MDYPAYEREQEAAAAGQHITDCISAIFAEVSPANDTLASLQHRVYKDSDAGVSVSFKLEDGTCIWCGDRRAEDTTLLSRARYVGCSCIIEGSEAAVDTYWLDLLDDAIQTPMDAVAAFNALVESVDEEAMLLWDCLYGQEDQEEMQ